MNRIRLLPEHVANQIAAGEVVERPASVVKELVENALDAQAARVTIEIQAGGRSLIRVTDDGFGMSRDDALLCLERHATSKIQKAEDLHAITSMGFRGEALPSIASVSRFSLITREREGSSPDGTQVIINGGKIVEVKAAGTATGTTVEVRQLFFNLPARRKFLRSEETERAHIQHYLTLAALAHPHVAFTFSHDGRLIWQLPAARTATDSEGRLGALQERLRAIYGGDLKLLSVNHGGELISNEPADESETHPQNVVRSAIRLWGFIGAPGVSRATREEQHVFVNLRPVENRGLNFALLEGYHTALMKGRYPVCCLFLEISPAEVDVNIHPSKREVKFHREREIRHFVANAILHTLLNFHSASPVSTAPSQTHASADSTVAGIPASSPAPSVNPLHAELPNFLPPLPGKPIPDWPQHPAEQKALPMGFSASPPAPPSFAAVPTTAPQNANSSIPAAPVPLLSVPLKLVGVIGKLYVVLESDRGLVLLDQHAAHERILFEQMLYRMEKGNAPSQRLLLPETVELPPRDAQFIRDLLPTLQRLGVGMSEFGERTFLLDALPPFVKAGDPRRFVVGLVDELKSAGESVNSMRLGEHTVAKTVCRHAVKANDYLTGPELENLVNDLRHCAMPYTCPHGRPTLIEMNYRELERKFGRSA